MRIRPMFVTLFLLGACGAQAGTVTISASDRGARASDGGGDFRLLGSYFAGRTTIGPDIRWRDYFDFAIPTLNGTLVSAKLALDQPTAGFSPADGGDTSHVFDVRGLGPDHSFGAIGAGTLYASVTLNAATNGTTVYIELSGLALANLLLAQGGMFHLGGVDSAEEIVPTDHWIGDWLGTGSDEGFVGVAEHTQLILETVTPEPSNWQMLLALGLATPLMRRIRRGCALAQ